MNILLVIVTALIILATLFQGAKAVIDIWDYFIQRQQYQSGTRFPKNMVLLTSILLILSLLFGYVTVTSSVNTVPPGQTPPQTPTGGTGSTSSPTPLVTATTIPTVAPTAMTPSPTLTIPPNPKQPVFLSNLQPIGGYPSDLSTQPISLDGTTYTTLVREDLFVCGTRQLDYDLGKKYSTFTAKAGLSDMYADTAIPWIFAVYTVDANGERTLFKQIMRFGQVVNVKVSVSGVLRLRLSIEWIDPGHLVTCSPYDSFDAVWANPTLTS